PVAERHGSAGARSVGGLGGHLGAPHLNMTGAELLVRCLEREGVRYVFGVPGEETLDVNDALERSSVRFIPVRHEQAAAFMADVWGRLGGPAGVWRGTRRPRG